MIVDRAREGAFLQRRVERAALALELLVLGNVLLGTAQIRYHMTALTRPSTNICQVHIDS